MERRWQKVAARDGAVEARGVNEGRLALAICSRVFVCRPSEAQDRVGRGLEGAGGFEGNAKGTRRLTRRERKRNAKGMRSEKREGNAKPKGMLKAEKGIRRGVTTSRARAPRACAVPVRVPRNSHARARRPATCTMQRMLWRPRCGWGSEWNDTSPRRCLGIRGKLSIPRYTNTTHTDTHTH